MTLTKNPFAELRTYDQTRGQSGTESAANGWTEDMRVAANSEGWNLARVGEFTTTLKREIPSNGIAHRFPDDRTALWFVLHRAFAGSDLHQSAIELWRRQNPTDYKRAIGGCASPECLNDGRIQRGNLYLCPDCDRQG